MNCMEVQTIVPNVVQTNTNEKVCNTKTSEEALLFSQEMETILQKMGDETKKKNPSNEAIIMQMCNMPIEIIEIPAKPEEMSLEVKADFAVLKQTVDGMTLPQEILATEKNDIPMENVTTKIADVELNLTEAQTKPEIVIPMENVTTKKADVELNLTEAQTKPEIVIPMEKVTTKKVNVELNLTEAQTNPDVVIPMENVTTKIADVELNLTQPQTKPEIVTNKEIIIPKSENDTTKLEKVSSENPEINTVIIPQKTEAVEIKKNVDADKIELKNVVKNTEIKDDDTKVVLATSNVEMNYTQNQTVVIEAKAQEVVQKEKNVQTYVPSIVNNISQKIVEAASFKTGNGTSEISIELQPEFLGKMNIKIISKDNKITASIKILNNEIKEALSAQSITITNYLKEQGINIKTIEFTDFSPEMKFNFQDKSERNQKEADHNNEKNVFINIFNNKKSIEYNENKTVDVRKYGKVNYFA